MKLDRAEIISKEDVGTDHLGNKIVHIKTLGGCNLIVSISPYNEVTVLGTGAHRAYARNQAETRSVIKWDQDSNLFKNEEASQLQADHHDSTPHKHFKLASYFSKKLGRIKKTADPSFEDKLLMTMMLDSALRHYSMSGLDKEHCKLENEKQMKYHKEVDDSYRPPYDDQLLTDSYNNKLTLKSEELEKDRGRITFPADPKISNRPDQEVRVLNSPNDGKIASKVLQSKTINKLKDEGAIINDDHNDQIKSFSNQFSYMPPGQGLTSQYVGPISVASKKGDLSSLKEHEGFHNLIANIRLNHGQAEAENYINHLNNSIPSDVKSYLDYNLVHFGYKAKELAEERIPHLRDLLHESTARNSYKENLNLDNESMLNHTNKMKNAWKDVLRSSSEYKINKSESTESNSTSKMIFDYFFGHIFQSIKKKE
jgi:hypothetical protein